MRTFIFSVAVLFLFIINVSNVQAASCPVGMLPGTDGRYFTEFGDECTPQQSIDQTGTYNTNGNSIGQTSVPTVSNTTLINPLNSGSCAPNQNCLLIFLNKILEFVIKIGTVVVVLMLVYVGFLFVTAQGNETKLTTAKQALLWTIVGALILLGSQAISVGIHETVKELAK